MNFIYSIWGLGIGDWGLGIGDWGLGPIPTVWRGLLFLIVSDYFSLTKRTGFSVFVLSAASALRVPAYQLS